jgi:hypothetical protein
VSARPAPRVVAAQVAVGVLVIGGLMLGAIHGALYLLGGGAVELLGPVPAAVVAAVGVAFAVRSLQVRARYVGGTRMVLHTHGNDDAEVAAYHESAHALMARAAGGTVSHIEIHPDGSGVTRLSLPRGATVEQRVAVDVAGEVGSGTSAGCESDYRYMRQALATVPGRERAAAKAAGYALARDTCTPAALRPVAQRLLKKGACR